MEPGKVKITIETENDKVTAEFSEGLTATEYLEHFCGLMRCLTFLEVSIVDGLHAVLCDKLEELKITQERKLEDYEI